MSKKNITKMLLDARYTADDIRTMRPFFNLIKNGIILTNTNSKILYANPASSKITGYSEKYAIGLQESFHQSGYHDKAFYKKITSRVAHDGFWEGEVWNRAKSGRVYPALLTVTPIKSHGKIVNYLNIFSDITFLKADKAKQVNLVFHDPLTKLPNRLSAKNYFSIAVQATIRKQFSLKKINQPVMLKIAIVFFDLNKFKWINDTHGHVVGDKVLQEMGHRLKKVSRSVDLVSRYGGDEFLAIFPNIKTDEDIIGICERMLTAFHTPFVIDNITLDISTSIGVSFYPDQGDKLEDLVKTADEAMYHSKKHNIKYVFYKNIK